MPARRRANGEGTISQHPDGRWWARITLADGKRKAFYGRTRKEVQQKLTAALRDQQQGLPVIAERETVGQFLARWSNDVARPKLRPRTYQRYQELLRLHALPTLGSRRLA